MPLSTEWQPGVRQSGNTLGHQTGTEAVLVAKATKTRGSSSPAAWQAANESSVFGRFGLGAGNMFEPFGHI